MIRTVHGVVRGKTIQLVEDLCVPDGETVVLQVSLVGRKRLPPGPPTGWVAGRASTTAGVLAEFCTQEDDRILDEIHRDRRSDGGREIAE